MKFEIDMSDFDKKLKKDRNINKKAWDSARKGTNFLIGYAWPNRPASVIANGGTNINKYELEGVTRISISSNGFAEKDMHLVRKIRQDYTDKIIDLKKKIESMNRKLRKLQQTAYDKGMQLKMEDIKLSSEVK